MKLTRREAIYLSLNSFVAAALATRSFAAGSGAGIYRHSIVIDGCGFPGGLQTDEAAPLNSLEVQQIGDSGLTAIQMTLGAVGTMPSLQAFEKIVRDISKWERQIDAYPDVMTRVRTAADITAAKTAGRTGLVYGLQDGVAFEDDLGRLDSLHQLGIRVIQPTYNRRNLLGDGCMEPSDAGLSRSGHEAIERMNDLGIMVDLSHCGRRTVQDAISASSKPVSFTHTGCQALAEHPRHRTDEEIKAVADKGGVTGIYIMPYLSKGAQPTAQDVVAHIEHALKVGGEDHVSLGTDGTVSPTELTPAYIEHFRKTTRMRKEQGIAAPYETETGYLFANDLNTPRRFETLTGLLQARGHSATLIEKILGGNLLRVFGETWV